MYSYNSREDDGKVCIFRRLLSRRRGNIYGVSTAGASYALEMAKIVAKEHPELPFVLSGHSLGGGTAMLAVEKIAQAFKGIYI
jgi:hypothetical protein